jgi:phage-related protein
MASPAILAIRIVADAKQATGQMDTASTKAGKFGQGVKVAGVAAAAGLAALTAGAAVAIQSASDMQQAYGAVDAVFKGNSDQVKTFAKDAAKSTGLAAADYANMAALIGSQLKNAGTAPDKLVGATDDLITKGADLAAMFGGTTADAVGALSSLLKGETDPIEKYGVSIKAADIAAENAKKGLKGLTGEAKKQADAQAIMTLLTEQTADATGASAREYDSLAASQQRNQANMENAKALIGTALLPLVSTLTQWFAKLAEWIGENSTLFLVLAGVLATIAVTVMAVNAAMAIYNTITTISTALTKAQESSNWKLAASFLANPVVLIVAGIILLVGALILAYKKSETFRAIVDAAFGAVLSAAKSVWAFLKGAFSAIWPVLLAVARPIITAISTYIKVWWTVISTVIDIVKVLLPAALRTLKTVAEPILSAIGTMFEGVMKVVQPIIDAVETLIDLLGKIKIPKIPKIPGLGRSAPAVAGGATAPGVPTAFAASAGTRTTRGAIGATVNVYGAVDPQQTARAVQRLLHNADVRAGRRRFA